MAARRRRWRWYALFGGLCLLGSAYFVGRRLAAPPYHGPVTDHFDGREFHNLGVVQERGPFALVRWWLTGRPVTWPKWRDIPPAQAPPARDDGLRVTFVNHATVLIQIADVNLITDPVWSDRST